MLGGGNQNPVTSQENKQISEDNNIASQDNLDDDIPF